MERILPKRLRCRNCGSFRRDSNALWQKLQLASVGFISLLLFIVTKSGVGDEISSLIFEASTLEDEPEKFAASMARYA